MAIASASDAGAEGSRAGGQERKTVVQWRGQGVIGTHKMSSFLSVTPSDTDVEMMRMLMPFSPKLNKHVPGIVQAGVGRPVDSDTGSCQPGEKADFRENSLAVTHSIGYYIDLSLIILAATFCLSDLTQIFLMANPTTEPYREKNSGDDQSSNYDKVKLYKATVIDKEKKVTSDGETWQTSL